jgi:HNH endonuclease
VGRAGPVTVYRLRPPVATERVRRAWRGPRAATPRQRWLLYRRQRGRCGWCRLPLGWPAEAHHIRPWARGGRTILRNLVLLHPACHAEADAATRVAATRPRLTSAQAA